MRNRVSQKLIESESSRVQAFRGKFLKDNLREARLDWFKRLERVKNPESLIKTRILPSTGWIKVTLPEVESKSISLILKTQAAIELRNFRYNLVDKKPGEINEESLSSLAPFVELDCNFVGLIRNFNSLNGKTRSVLAPRLAREIGSVVDERVSAFAQQVAELSAQDSLVKNLSCAQLEVLAIVASATADLRRHLLSPREFTACQEEVSELMAPHYSSTELDELFESDGTLLVSELIERRRLFPTSRRNAISDAFLRLGAVGREWLGVPPALERGTGNGLIYQELIPNVGLEDVILPERLMTDIKAIAAEARRQKESSQSERLILLFKGVPGTGKTTTAHAFAREMSMRVMRVNCCDLNGSSTAELLQDIALRCKARNAVLLLDECESLFEEYRIFGKSPSWARQFLETVKGVVILTTNSKSLGEPIERRCSYIARFPRPTVESRSRMLTNALAKAGIVLASEEVRRLAEDSILSGGHLEQALSLARARIGAAPTSANSGEVVWDCIAHTEKEVLGASAGGARVRVPSVRLKDVSLSAQQERAARAFLEHCKRNRGRELAMRNPLLPKGVTALFTGYPGTGKSLLAEAISGEMGLRFRKVSPSAVLSMWHGETESNLRELFNECREEGHVLFIDEAEGLFWSRGRSSRSWEVTQVNELLQCVEEFQGILIAATNTPDLMDPAFIRRFVFHLDFQLPTSLERQKIWSNLSCGTGIESESIVLLAQEFTLSGGEIRNVITQAMLSSAFRIDALRELCARELSFRNDGTNRERIGLK